ncbi:MAG TPA: glycosyl hydrolase [Thermoanaerobaculia bacterium]|nr:glycosyl hydrolase [Thermoanaerobaculia bacterium]
MTARRRYQIAFFALGWLIALAILLEGATGPGLRGLLARAEDALAGVGQSLSNAEGDALQRVRGRSRRDLLAPFRPSIATRAALLQPGRMLFGAYDGGFPDSFRGLDSLETRLGYRFPVISFYQAWGDRPDQAHFPRRMAETIDQLGSIPMITWEPWVKDFDESRRTNLPNLAQREYATLAAIARGDYDFYITPWAVEAARFGKPILLRFAHEMNDPYRYPWGPQNGNRPDDFIAAWKHAHMVFQKMNATNVLWVWSPHISMPWFEYYYPGAEWVDWVGTGVLNYGDVAPWSRWWTFEQIFGKAYPALEKLQKPIMITEFGTLTSGGDARQWYREAFDQIENRYPRIRAIVFFNQERDVTLSTAPLNWSVLQSPAATLVVRDVLRRGQPSP